MSTSSITLRPVTIHDISILKFWDTLPHVIAAAPNDIWDWEYELQRQLEWRELLIAESNQKPIGVIQIIDPAKEDTHYWGKVPNHLKAIDIWIGEKENLGKGFGTTMMHLAFKRCFKDQLITAILIDPLESNTKAHRFYKRLGFEFVQKKQFDKDVCFIFRLTRKTWQSKLDLEHQNK